MREINVPDLGEHIEQAAVLRVLVDEDDLIEKDQPLLELETDKATFELPAPFAGRVAEVRTHPGETITVGQTVLIIGEAEGARPAAPAPREGGAPRPAPTVQERVAPPAPREAAPARPIPPVSEPVARPAPHEAAPAPREVAPTPSMEAMAEPPTPPSAPTKPPAPPPQPWTGDGHRAHASPSTRRLARELGIDLGEVQGSGPHGRITPDDLKHYVREGGNGGQEAAIPLPSFERWGPVERQPLNRVRSVAAERLSLAWRTIPHVTQHELAEITALEAARQRYEATRADYEPKMTLTVLAIRAVLGALKAYPWFNSSFDQQRNEIVLKRYYHLGIAVDTEHGLLVPVLRDADKKGLRQLALELEQLVKRAREHRLAREEMEGGTFTISNQGGLAGTSFTPIINPPEVAILGISSARPQPHLSDGAVEQQLILPLSLSYDHRVINGADAVRFIHHIATGLSDPLHLLMEL